MIERVFRDEWGRVLASLVGFLGDFDLAEDVTQEAFAVAVERWPRDGMPGSCVVRLKPDVDSGRIRTPNPVQSGR